jgi:hypothetical protein
MTEKAKSSLAIWTLATFSRKLIYFGDFVVMASECICIEAVFRGARTVEKSAQTDLFVLFSTTLFSYTRCRKLIDSIAIYAKASGSCAHSKPYLPLDPETSSGQAGGIKEK